MMDVAAQDLRLDSVAPTFSSPSPAHYRMTRDIGLIYILESQSSVKQSASKWSAQRSQMVSVAYTGSLSGLISVRSIHSSQDSILAAPMYFRK